VLQQKNIYRSTKTEKRQKKKKTPPPSSTGKKSAHAELFLRVPVRGTKNKTKPESLKRPSREERKKGSQGRGSDSLFFEKKKTNWTEAGKVSDPELAGEKQKVKNKGRAVARKGKGRKGKTDHEVKKERVSIKEAMDRRLA